MDTDSQIRHTAPCPVCGSTEYEWGTLGSSYITNFVAESDGWFARSFSQVMGTKSAARRCKKCGNLQLFTDVSHS